MTGTKGRRRTLLTGSLAVALAAGTVGLAAGASAGADAGSDAGRAGGARSMMPTGGGYEPETLEAFGAAAAARSGDDTVVLAVVPSAYGDDWPSRPENIALAKERTAEIEAACTAVVAAPKRCVGRFQLLLNRADALRPANSAALRDPSLDGVYILGGDQGIAMKVLANSPAERSMNAAYDRGVIIAGTSAGAAVESRSMINGYNGDFGASDGLRKDAPLIWWGDDADRERGLAFGSRQAIYDQHFYQRGRFGRLLTTIALADERFGGASPLGVGADYATGVVNTGDRSLSGVFGQGSVALIDDETFGATHRWVGPDRLLSTRGVLTALMTDHTAYDLTTRVLTHAGTAPAIRRPQAYAFPTVGSGTLYLGGGLQDGGAAIADFVKTATAARPGPNARLVVLAADGASTAADYGALLKEAGWGGRLDTYAYGESGWAGADLAGADAVAVVSVAPEKTRRAMADTRFRDLVAKGVSAGGVALADGPMAAALGNRWSPVARPTDDNYEDVAVLTFRVGEATWQRGLGLVDTTLVPTLNTDYLWGRLYAAVRAQPSRVAYGVTTGAAVKVTASGARVVGGSVVALDGRSATRWTGANGSFGTAGATMDVYAPGEGVRR